MKGRLVKYSAFVAAVVVLIVLLSSCETTTPQQPQQPVEVKELEIKDVKVEPSALYEGEEFSMSFKVDGQEGEKIVYRVKIGDQEEAGSAEIGKVITIEKLRAPRLGPEEGNEARKSIVITVEYMRYSYKTSKSYNLTVYKDKEPEVSIVSYPKTVAIEKGGGADVTIAFEVKDDAYKAANPENKYVTYEITINGVKYAGTGEGEKVFVDSEATVISKEIHLEYNEDFRWNIVVTVKDYLDKSDKAEKTILAEIGKNLGFDFDEGAVLGGKNKTVTGTIKYTPEVEEGNLETEATFKVEVFKDGASESVYSTTVTFEMDELKEYEKTVTIKAEDLNADEAGKYIIRVVKENSESPAQKSSYFYFNPPEGYDFELEPSKGLFGKESAEFYFKIKSEGAKSVLINKEGFASISLGVKSGEPSVELDGASESLDDFFVVELPATFVFKFDEVTTDEVEENGVAATATFVLADGDEKQATATFDVDTLGPRFELKDFYQTGLNTWKIEYEIEEEHPCSDGKAGTLTIYVGDEEKPVSISANATEAEVTIDGYYDHENLKGSFEGVDNLNNETHVPNLAEISNYYIDNAVSRVWTSWKPEGEYLASTSVTLQVVVEDKEGIFLPSDLNIDHSAKLTLVSSELVGRKEEGEFWKSTIEYVFKVSDSPTEVEIATQDATVSFNKLVVLELNGEKLEKSEFNLPSSVVLDTVKPTVEILSFKSNGDLEFNVNDGYLEEITIEASFNGSSAEIVSFASKTSAYKFTKEDFEKLFGKVPDGNEVVVWVKAKDKAENSNEASTATILDLVPPAVKLEGATAISLSSTQVTFVVKTADDNSKIYSVIFIGGDVKDLEVVYDSGSSTGVATNTDAADPWNAVKFPDGIRQATLTVTFIPNAVLNSENPEIEIWVNAKDNTYDDNYKLGVLDYSELMPPEDIVDLKELITCNSSNFVLVEENLGEYKLKIDDKYYEYDTEYLVVDASESIEVDDGTGEATVTATVTFDAGGRTWLFPVKKTETLDSMTTLSEFVPDKVFTLDNIVEGESAVKQIGDKYYWNVKDAKEIVIQLPVSVGLAWKAASNDNLFTVDVDAGTNAVATITVAFDDASTTFDSTDYSTFSGQYLTGEATAFGYVYNDDGASEAVTPLFKYKMDDFMDYYKVSVLESDATITGVDNSAATLVIWLKLDAPVLPTDATFLANVVATLTTNSASYATDFGKVASSVELNADTILATLTTDSTNLFGIISSATSAAADIRLDGIKFLLKPEGYDKGFWLTNFDAAINIR